jgi:predicted metal-dependent hydrolase
MISQSLQYGALRIPYEVAYLPARTGKIAIHVLPTGIVRVDAPQGASLAEIKRGVGKRARWLSEHVGRIRDRAVHILPKSYVSGESHLYLGRRYLLKVRSSRRDEPSVKLRQGRFQVVTDCVERDRVGSLLSEWYRARARVFFPQRLSLVASRLAWLRGEPRWRLLTMKRQWGSCSPQGVLSLNPNRLRAAPRTVSPETSQPQPALLPNVGPPATGLAGRETSLG